MKVTAIILIFLSFIMTIFLSVVDKMKREESYQITGHIFECTDKYDNSFLYVVRVSENVKDLEQYGKKFCEKEIKKYE